MNSLATGVHIEHIKAFSVINICQSLNKNANKYVHPQEITSRQLTRSLAYRGERRQDGVCQTKWHVQHEGGVEANPTIAGDHKLGSGGGAAGTDGWVGLPSPSWVEWVYVSLFSLSFTEFHNDVFYYLVKLVPWSWQDKLLFMLTFRRDLVNTEVLLFLMLKENTLPPPLVACLSRPWRLHAGVWEPGGQWKLRQRWPACEGEREGVAAFPPPQESCERGGVHGGKALCTSATSLWKVTFNRLVLNVEIYIFYVIKYINISL